MKIAIIDDDIIYANKLAYKLKNFKTSIYSKLSDFEVKSKFDLFLIDHHIENKSFIKVIRELKINDPFIVTITYPKQYYYDSNPIMYYELTECISNYANAKGLVEKYDFGQILNLVKWQKLKKHTENLIKKH